jgi:RNA polymerase sigma-70 factor (ECF subfamily)
MGTQDDETARRAKLVRIARRVHTAAEAEDVVHDVLLRLHERGAEDVRSLDGWLVTAVRRHAIDARRRSAVERRVLQRFAADFAPSATPRDEHRGRSPDAAFVEALIATVGPGIAAALLLRTGFDLPYADLARGSGRSAVAWRQHLHRVLDRLRRTGLAHRPLDDDEARAALACRQALTDGDPARLHALVRTAPMARAPGPVGGRGTQPPGTQPPGTPIAGAGGAGRATTTLAMVGGRYVLALVLDGVVLCAVPVGPTDVVDPSVA